MIKVITILIFVCLISFTIVSADVILVKPGSKTIDNESLLNVNSSEWWITNEGVLDNVADILHNWLDATSLLWSNAGHIMDTDLDMGGNDIHTVNDLTVDNDAYIADQLEVDGDAWIDEQLNVTGDILVERGGNIEVFDNGNVSANYFFGSGLHLEGINISGGVINITGDFTGYAMNTSFLFGADGIGGIDMRGDPWYFSGADFQIVENLIVDNNISADWGFFTNLNTTNLFVGDINVSKVIQDLDGNQFIKNNTDGHYNISIDTNYNLITGNITPQTVNTHDLGNFVDRWKNLYLSGEATMTYLKVESVVRSDLTPSLAYDLGTNLNRWGMVYTSGADFSILTNTAGSRINVNTNLALDDNIKMLYGDSEHGEIYSNGSDMIYNSIAVGSDSKHYFIGDVVMNSTGASLLDVMLNNTDGGYVGIFNTITANNFWNTSIRSSSSSMNFSVGDSTTLANVTHIEMDGGTVSISPTHPMYFRMHGEENANLDGSNGGFEFAVGNGQEARTLTVTPCDGIIYRMSLYCEVSTATTILVNLTDEQVDTSCGVNAPGTNDGISVVDCAYEFDKNTGLSARTTITGTTANQCIVEAWGRCY